MEAKPTNEEKWISVQDACPILEQNSYLLKTLDRTFYAMPASTWHEIKGLIPKTLVYKAIVVKTVKPPFDIEKPEAFAVMSTRTLADLMLPSGETIRYYAFPVTEFDYS